MENIDNHWPAEVAQLLRQPAEIRQAQRLFHGRGHAYPGLKHVSIDWLPPVALITLHAEASLAEVSTLVDFLWNLSPDCTSVQLQHRYLRHGPVDILKGDHVTELEVLEDDLKFHLSLGKVRNTGLFLDMKNGRQWVRQNSQGLRVLNLFAYTCGFSVAAAAASATAVVNVDMSSSALSIGRDNHRLNQHSLENLRFEKLNIFKSFGRLSRRGPFDLLICDPPTFQKGSVDISRDYPKILQRLDQLMAPQATLMLCLNAPHLGRDFLITNMEKAAPEFILTEEIDTPDVFVEAENRGLKTMIFTRNI